MNPGTLPKLRHVYAVLGVHSLPYAKLCLGSLLSRALEPIRLTLITDDGDAKSQIEQAVAELRSPTRHSWRVVAKAEVDELAAEQFRGFDHLMAFREGHPCWRKITDPLLLAKSGGEVITLDPDVYFPNNFEFEPTPTNNLYLMWQPTHCLLPHESVMRAYDSSIKLAHHTDIGVAQFQGDLDLDWLNRFVGSLGGTDIPRQMHVESIVWAALALRMGGGYLSPIHWYCWQNRHWKRALRSFGVNGATMLAWERISQMKCFHAGGKAKWWLQSAADRGVFDHTHTISGQTTIIPFEELAPAEYYRGQRIKRVARAIGYF